jgi:hypothetical protein
MPEFQSTGDSEIRKCLVLVRYRKLDGAPWRRVGPFPQIETYLNDVAQKYQEPCLTYVTPHRISIRVFNEQAVNLARVIDQLGDFSEAVAQCDECLRAEVLGEDEFDFNSHLEVSY